MRVCAFVPGRGGGGEALHATAPLLHAADAQVHVLVHTCIINLFPPNVPMWEHDLKDNFWGFSFEQFFSKLVPHLEQMFSPLSVKKHNFEAFVKVGQRVEYA